MPIGCVMIIMIVADFIINNSELNDDILSGEGRVKWGHARPNHVEFSCLFQDHRVDDTNYVLININILLKFLGKKGG